MLLLRLEGLAVGPVARGPGGLDVVVRVEQHGRCPGRGVALREQGRRAAVDLEPTGAQAERSEQRIDVVEAGTHRGRVALGADGGDADERFEVGSDAREELGDPSGEIWHGTLLDVLEPVSEHSQRRSSACPDSSRCRS